MAVEMKWVKASAPGKIILAGEHAVVYGYSAIAAAVDRRLIVSVMKGERGERLTGLAKFALDLMQPGEEKTAIKIKSDLPVNRGLGSSAALATALVWALNKGKKIQVKNEWVKKIEDKQHGQSSGVDQTVVREGGFIKFQKVKGKPRFEPIKININEAILIDSGKPEESTGEMVAKVSRGKFKGEFEEIAAIVKKWQPELISANQRLLEKIGVVGKQAKIIVREVEKIGGQAKVCGAGGIKKGSGIILVYHQDRKKVLKLAKERQWKTMLVSLGAEGVRYE